MRPRVATGYEMPSQTLGLGFAADPCDGASTSALALLRLGIVPDRAPEISNRFSEPLADRCDSARTEEQDGEKRNDGEFHRSQTAEHDRLPCWGFSLRSFRS